MSERDVLTAAELKRLDGQEIGVSKWFQISQQRIDGFAEVTEDWQFIHTDPERARQTPFGGAVAHGFLTLSMLSAMAQDAIPPLEGAAVGVNYGFDKIRFLSPVPSGARIRGRFALLAASEVKAGELTIRYGVDVEIEGQERLALTAEWITRQYFHADGSAD